MFVKDLTLALGLTLAAFAAPAQAQEGTLWKTVGDWDISVDATIGNGCYALASWNGGTVLRIGRNPEQNNFYFLIGNDKWTSLRDDQSYDLEIRFDSRPVWNVSATGLQFNPGETVYLHAQSTKMNFINEFQAALTMSISYNGAEIDSLKLSVKVTEQRGRHLDKLFSWLDERGLPIAEDNLLNYLRTIPLESRNRREGETAARLLLMTAKRQKLKIPRGELWKRPAPKKNEPLDSDAVIAAILRLVKVFPESGWLTAMVALTGSRGAMVMSSEVLWNPVPIEIGTYIRCRDDKKGRSREANLCPSWKDLLLALPKGFIDNPPEMLKEARKPFERAPTQKEQRKEPG